MEEKEKQAAHVAGSQQYRACREGQKLLFCFFGVLLMVVVMTAIAAVAVVMAAAVTVNPWP